MNLTGSSRRIGLSRPKAKKSSSQQPRISMDNLSPEDETQQPMMGAASLPPQFVNEPIVPPAPSAPAPAPADTTLQSSEIAPTLAGGRETQEESTDVIHWGNTPRGAVNQLASPVTVDSFAGNGVAPPAPTMDPGSPTVSSESGAPLASDRDNAPTEINGAVPTEETQKDDPSLEDTQVNDAEPTQINETEDEVEEVDSSSVATRVHASAPAIPQSVSTPTKQAGPSSSKPMSSTRSAPPTASPSSMAAPPASGTRPNYASPLRKGYGPVARLTSPRPYQPQTQESGSDDFAHDMNIQPKPIERFSKIMSPTSNRILSNEVPVISRGRQSGAFASRPGLDQGALGSTSRANAGRTSLEQFAESTFLNEPSADSSHPEVESTRLLQYSDTNTEIPEKSEPRTSPPAFPPSSPPPRNFAFGDLVSTAGSQQGSSLFSDGDVYMGLEEPSQSQSQGLFQATQMMLPQISEPALGSSELVDLPSQPAPPCLATTVSTGSSKSSARTSLPAHRMLQRRTRSITHILPTVQQARRTPSPVDEGQATYVEPEATYVDPSITIAAAPSSAPIAANGSASGREDALPPATERAAPLAPPPEPTSPLISIPERPSTPQRSPSPPPPVLTGVHEIESMSLARAPPPRHSPNKYGGRSKASTRPVSPLSDCSSDPPDDPDDHTFQEPSASPLPPNVKTPSAKTQGPMIPRGIVPPSSTSESRFSRGKRKALSPSPDLSGPSSGSAPEDEEDFSYRPAKKKPRTSKSKDLRKKIRFTSGQSTSKASSAQRTTASTAMPAPSVPDARSRSVTPAARAAASRTTSVAGPSISAGPSAPPTRDPLRVLGLWGKTGEYYAGTVVGRNAKGFRIKFDDGYHSSLGIDKLRMLHLRPGEPVFDGTKTSDVFHVASEFGGQGDTVETLDRRSKTHRIPIARLVVMPTDIAARFHDRVLELDALDALFPPPSARGSVIIPSGGQVFTGMVFIITGASTNMDPDSLRRSIEANGGTVASQWESVFVIKDSGFELVSTSTPFVIQIGARCIMTPKVMAALAAGVPILAARYVEDAIKSSAHWGSYLISLGESPHLGTSVSQFVDSTWGSSTWDASKAGALIKPFTGTTIHYVEPSSRFSRRDELKVLVPFCLAALGATVVRTSSLPTNFDACDLVMVEDRDRGRPLSKPARSSGKLVNAAWLKQCLKLGISLPPSLAADGDAR